MSVIVRPADLEFEKSELLNVLKRNLGGFDHARRFEWLYRNNPAGRGWTWFVCEPGSQSVVGVASVFSRVMWVSGRKMLCGQIGDFAIDSNYRSLGPAMLLQRATFEPVNQGTLAFCYDCPPHEAGMSTFRRLGMRPNCHTQRLVRPLRADHFVEKRLGVNFFSKSVAATGNVILRTMARRRNANKNLEITIHACRFDAEFDELEERTKSQDSICSRRSSADLNWRYRDNPLHEYQVLTARVHGQLSGFAVFSVSGNDANIIDLFGVDIAAIAADLIEAIVDKCHEASLQTVHAVISEGSNLTGLLLKSHFRRRSSGPRVVAYAKESALSALLKQPSNWHFQQIDLLA